MVPLKEGLWTQDETGKKVWLIGSKCEACGEIFFPKKDKGWCIHCQKDSLKDVQLSNEGTIVSFSVVMQQPGGRFYQGPVPYAYGQVELPEGLRIIALFDSEDFNDLSVGKAVTLVIDKLFEDEEGKDILTFKFRTKNEKNRF